MNIHNDSGWPYSLVPHWTAERKRQPILVVKTGFQWDDEGTLTPLAEADIEIEPVDRFYQDDADNASLAACADTVPFKQGFEFLLSGTAHSNCPCKALTVAATVNSASGQPVWHKQLRVAGPRRWQRSLLGWIPSEPDLFESLPLHYEFAFGGRHGKNPDKLFAQNPAGLGFNASKNQPGIPQIEQLPWLTSPKQTQAPAGFGPLAPHWSPRLERLQKLNADAAQQGACPYPRPLDPRLYNAAPDDQIWHSAPATDSTLTLRGLHPQRPEQQIRLPQVAPSAWLESADLTLVWDTLLVDADRQRLYQLWRTAVPIDLAQLPTLNLTLSCPNITASEVA